MVYPALGGQFQQLAGCEELGLGVCADCGGHLPLELHCIRDDRPLRQGVCGAVRAVACSICA